MKKRNKAAQMLGKLGGLKRGNARAAKLNPERRAEIAEKAAKARRGKNTQPVRKRVYNCPCKTCGLGFQPQSWSPHPPYDNGLPHCRVDEESDVPHRSAS
jgi:hypothetical protein